MSQGFIDDIHHFRGLSIVLIVSSHIWYTDLSSSFFSVTSAVFLNSTIFFAFISGFLFQYLLSRYDFQSYFRKKALYVLLPYVIISIPAIFFRLKTGPSYFALLNNEGLAQESTLYQVAYYYLTGAHQLPLWYLPMITLFFVLAPVFKFIDEHPRLYWLLPAFFVLSLLLPRGDFAQLNNIPRMFGHFLFVYVWGMFVSHYKQHFDELSRKYIIWFTLLFAALFALSLIEFEYRAQVIFVQKIVAIFVLLYVFKRLSNKFWISVFDDLALTSFGIYFVHFYIIQALRKVSARFMGVEYPDNGLIWFVELFLILGLSFLVVRLIQLILKKNSRYLIGS